MSASFEISLEDQVTPNANKASSSLSGLLGSFQGLFKGGITNGLESISAGFGDWLSKLDPVEIGVKAVSAAVSFLASTLRDMSLLAIKLTQEKDALREVFDVLTGQAGGGSKLLDELEDLSKSLPFTADKLNAWAKSLLAAGIQGEALKQSIRAIAAATAIMGESGGRAAETLIKRFAMMAEAGQKVKLDRRILSQLAEAGVSIADLAKALGVPAEKLAGMSLDAKKLGDAMQQALINKGEGPLKKMGATWDVIKSKLREGFEDAFEDLGELVGPFMKELQSLASEFFAGGIAATTFKDVVKKVLGVVFEVGTRTVRALHMAFLYLEIGFLRARIALKPITGALGKLADSGTIVNIIMYGLAATAIILTVVLGVLAIAVFLLVLPFLLVGAAIGLLIFGVIKLGSYISEAAGKVRTGASDILNSISSTVSSAIAWLANLGPAAASAGADFIGGLFNAIVNGEPFIVNAIIALANKIVSAIMGALLISSPSKVAMRIGGHFTTGLAEGIDAGQGDVAAAARGAGGAAIGGTAGGAAAAKGARGGTEIHIHEGAVVIHGAGGDVRTLTREALALILEEAALQAGV